MSHRNNTIIYPLPSISYDPVEHEMLRKTHLKWQAVTLLALMSLAVMLVLAINSDLAVLGAALMVATLIIAWSIRRDYMRHYDTSVAHRDYVVEHFDAVKALPAQIERDSYDVKVVELESDDQLLLTVLPKDPMYRQHEYLVTPTCIKVITGPRLDSILGSLKLVAMTDELNAADAAIHMGFELRDIAEIDPAYIENMRLKGDD